MERERFQSQLEMLVQELEKSQLDLLETNNQLKATQQHLASAQQNSVGKAGIDEAQRKEIEAQLMQMEDVKKQLDNQAKAIESERKLFEEQRYATPHPPYHFTRILRMFLYYPSFVIGRTQKSDRVEAKRIGREGKETDRVRSAAAEAQGANGSTGEVPAKGTKWPTATHVYRIASFSTNPLLDCIQAGGTAAAAGELNKKLTEAQQQLST